MKKFLSLMLVIFVLFNLCACSNSNTNQKVGFITKEELAQTSILLEEIEIDQFVQVNTGHYVNGKIFVFTLNEDNTMNHVYTYSVNEGEFAYSCMSITKDGNVGLLWEPGNNERSAIRYDEFEMKYVLGEEILRDVVVEAGKTYTDTFVGEEAMALTTKPNEDVATVTVETAEEVSVPLYNHNGSKNGNEPIKSFAANANTALLLQNAEFEFIKTDNEGIYTIKNKVSGQYLANNAAQNMCEANAVNMKVEKVTDGETGAVSFRISNSGKNRYIMFYLTQMNFNCHGGSGTTNTANTDYNLVLFEKKIINGDVNGYGFVES